MDRACGHCKSPVYDQESLRCWNCGRMLGEKTGFISGLRFTKPKIIFILSAFLVLLAFVAWII